MGISKSVAAEAQFFSVRKPVTFGGKTYRPSVCYRMTSDVFDTVSALAGSGGADLYVSQVRFVSGRAQPVNTVAAPVPYIIPPNNDTALRVSEQKAGRKQSSSASVPDGKSTGEYTEEKV